MIVYPKYKSRKIPKNGLQSYICFDCQLQFPLGDETFIYLVRQMMEISHITHEKLYHYLNLEITTIMGWENGKIELKNTIFSLNTVISNLIFLMAEAIAAKGLGFTISTSDNLPEYYRGDQSRLTYILINLVGNALKFTDKGSIRIDVKSLESNDDEVDIIFFKVTDTSIGVSSQATAAIFNPHIFQDDTIITRRDGGIGLGLVVCEKLVRLMGGGIWCENKEKHYSSFMFTVRLGHIVNSAIKMAEPIVKSQLINIKSLTAQLNGYHILLAKDNDLNQLVTRESLKKVWINVTIIENWYQILDIVEKEEFDLVLMDIPMPEMDGITATEHIRRQERFKDLPITAMIAHAMSENSTKILEAGM